MKTGTTTKTGVLRRIKAGISAFASAKGSIKDPVSDTDVISVMRKMVKAHKDSIEQFEKAGRTDLVAAEKIELEQLETFLPAQLSDEQVEKLVLQAIADTQATSKKDMGRVIRYAVELAKGQADSKLISQFVGTHLK